MIISRGYAAKLRREGKATWDGSTKTDDGRRWQIVIRHDLQRVDHFELFSGQPTYVTPRKVKQ